MTEKIKRLAKTRREGRQEARVAVRSYKATEYNAQIGQELSMGISRVRNLFSINMAIRNHSKLLAQIEEQIKCRLRTYRTGHHEVYIDEEQAGQTRETTIPTKIRTPVRRSSRPYRHHTRPWNTSRMADDNKPVDSSEELEAPTFLQELWRHRLNKWTQREDTVARYRTALDTEGGAL